jgi:hypothetical protein
MRNAKIIAAVKTLEGSMRKVGCWAFIVVGIIVGGLHEVVVSDCELDRLITSCPLYQSERPESVTLHKFLM